MTDHPAGPRSTSKGNAVAEPPSWNLHARIRQAELEIGPDPDPRTYKPCLNLLREVAEVLDSLESRIDVLERRRSA